MNDLNREVGLLKGTVEALEREVQLLRVEVKNLTAVLNQGKGARLAFIVGYTFLTILGGALAFFGIKVST